jgi:hypothetical protein
MLASSEFPGLVSHAAAATGAAGSAVAHGEQQAATAYLQILHSRRPSDAVHGFLLQRANDFTTQLLHCLNAFVAQKPFIPLANATHMQHRLELLHSSLCQSLVCWLPALAGFAASAAGGVARSCLCSHWWQQRGPAAATAAAAIQQQSWKPAHSFVAASQATSRLQSTSSKVAMHGNQAAQTAKKT